MNRNHNKQRSLWFVHRPATNFSGTSQSQQVKPTRGYLIVPDPAEPVFYQRDSHNRCRDVGGEEEACEEVSRSYYIASVSPGRLHGVRLNRGSSAKSDGKRGNLPAQTNLGVRFRSDTDRHCLCSRSE